jgi:hypothetical protein
MRDGIDRRTPHEVITSCSIRHTDSTAHARTRQDRIEIEPKPPSELEMPLQDARFLIANPSFAEVIAKIASRRFGGHGVSLR